MTGAMRGLLACSRPTSVCASVVAVLFLAAGVSKAVDPSGVYAVAVHLVPDWRWHREWLVAGAASLVALEAALGLLLVFIPVRAVRVVSALCLVALTVVLIRLGLDDSAPRCGCFGGRAVVGTARADAWLGVLRNLGAIALLALSGTSTEPAAVTSAPGSSPESAA